MGIDLPLIWAIIIGFGLMMYVIMDGFDLGIGDFVSVHSRPRRSRYHGQYRRAGLGRQRNLVGPGRRGVAGGLPARLFGACLSALYLPMVLMLGGLIWRGVAFEFRFKADEAHKPFWDKAFAGGSYIATFSQGVALGAFIYGFRGDRRRLLRRWS